MQIQPKETKLWKGHYQGLDFEIWNWSLEGFSDSCWNYYIFIHLGRIPDKAQAYSLWIPGKKDKHFGRIIYDYMVNELLDRVYFHGGITFYKKESGFDRVGKVIKIGCDYGHAFDAGYNYILGEIKADVQKTIESFRRVIPGYKYWCHGNGKLYDLAEGKIMNGHFISDVWASEKIKEAAKQIVELPKDKGV